VWGEILARLPEAQLILDFAPFAEPRTQAHYRDLLARHGVDVSRVILRRSANIFEGLNDIDILLDSFPHSGGTMLMDALWMGVPALTLASRPPLGRLCTTMLMNLGLPEWIAATEADYIDKACGFANRPELLNELRLGMRERMKHSPLMDGPAFARDMEAAYRGMFEHWLDTVPPWEGNVQRIQGIGGRS
jgi:predicted O-linked N-acetylglucosamine transferase (SPINDLY family)